MAAKEEDPGGTHDSANNTSKAHNPPDAIKRRNAECLRSRRRREAAKTAHQTLENQIKDLEVTLQSLRIEGKELSEKHTALSSLSAYQEEMMQAIQAHNTDNFLHKSISMVGTSGSDVYSILSQALSQAFETGNLPEIKWFKTNYITFPTDLLVSFEKKFVELLDKTVAQWNACPSLRSGIESRLKSVFYARRLISQLMLEERPELHRIVACSPTPNSLSSDYRTLVESLNVSDEQKRNILPAWAQYQERMALLNFKAAEAQQALMHAHSVDVSSAGRASKNFHDVAEAVAWLESYRPRALAIYGYLILGVQSELEPLQSAHLLLGCRPFVPDLVSFCKIIFEGGDVVADTSKPLALMP